jgi:uncharacterized membrane protein
MAWYCVVDGQRQGPLEEERLRAMIQAGQVKGSDLVWSDAHGPDWVRADSVPVLAPAGLPPGLPPHQPPAAAHPGWAPPAAAAPSAPAFPSAPGTPTLNVTLMAQARECLAGHWWEAIGASALVALVSLASGAIPFIGWVLGLLLGGALQLGLVAYFVAVARRESPRIGKAFSGFDQFGRALPAYLLVLLFTFLWSLLLIVPGIIAAYRYSMTFYLINDDPKLGASEAIERSKAMMDGHKWRLFCLHFRFLGWILLAMLTCGLGMLVVLPYLLTSVARFYDDLGRVRRTA